MNFIKRLKFNLIGGLLAGLLIAMVKSDLLGGMIVGIGCSLFTTLVFELVDRRSKRQNLEKNGVEDDEQD